MNIIKKKSDCIRKAINNSSNKDFFKFDKSSYNKDKIIDNLETASPKLLNLINNIKELDNNDFLKYGKRFKHIIYSDLRNSLAGIKLIASAFKAYGYNNIYNKNFQININDDNRDDNRDNNFALLTSMTIYDKPFSVKLRKQIIEIFNSRPDNINGEKIRFLLIDQGFKEGIDVFDVKYIHIFEELITPNDEKQVIGRGTRFCGQKGLTFHPELGWALHIFKYRLLLSSGLNEIYRNESDAFSLFINESGIDIKKLYFASELESICRFGSVDYEINRAIHEFGNDKDDKLDVNSILDIINRFQKFPLKDIYESFDKKNKKEVIDEFDLAKKAKYKFGGVNDNNKNLKPKPIIRKKTERFIDIKKVKGIPKILKKKLDFIEMRKYVRKYFKVYKWTNIKFENLCISDSNNNPNQKSRIVQLNNSQLFVSNFFTSQSPYKGILFWHSVGTGKTCAAIATASNSFEKDNYTILWVTRHTLKPDVWKNIYKEVCSKTIIEKMEKDNNIPMNPNTNKLKYLDNKWIMPLSYKQFTNLIEKKNNFYNDLVNRNGKDDPLRKTLIIIDEAHKLYSEETPANERPNINSLKKAIYGSYEKSKKNSCKLLLMTATPYTNEPVQLFKLLNLLKEDDYLNENIDEFKEEFLDDNYKFTKEGSRKFLDKISGYISYLDRERDVRHFAYPVIYIRDVNMSSDDSNNNEIDENFYELFFEDIKDYLLISIPETKEIINNMNEFLIKNNKKTKIDKSLIPSQETTIKECLNIKEKGKKETKEKRLKDFIKVINTLIKEKEKEDKKKEKKIKKEEKEEKEKEEIEIINGKKYKKCPEGKIRNPKTMRCIKKK